MTPFAVEVPIGDDEKMAAFQEMMNEIHDETNKYISELAKELNVSEACAMDVWYLRTRNRHTPELEEKLIALHAQGVPVNMCEF